ncbi:MAG: hypothetical protein ACKO3C_12995 [Betaproteobacteria bacterium]|nr:hypothetical protein [Betaproteobacteria bacterium]
MSFANTNDDLRGTRPTVFPAGAEVVAVRYAVDLTAADLDAGDVGAVGILPAGCVPVSLVIDADDLDSHATPTLVSAVGLLNAAGTDLATVFAAGLTVGQSAGVTTLSSLALQRLSATQADRLLGLKVTTGAATKAAGQVGFTLLYKAV